jgi:hypothetical protein
VVATATFSTSIQSDTVIVLQHSRLDDDIFTRDRVESLWFCSAVVESQLDDDCRLGWMIQWLYTCVHLICSPSCLAAFLCVFVCVCVFRRAGAKCFAQTSCLAKIRQTWQPTQTTDTFWDSISKTLFSTLSQQHASMVSTFPSKLHRKVSRRRRRKTRREIFFSVNNFYISLNFFLFFFEIFLCELTSLFFRFSSSPTPADSALLFSPLIRHDPTCVCICDALSLLLFGFVFFSYCLHFVPLRICVYSFLA